MLNLNCLEYFIVALTAKLYLSNSMNELEHILVSWGFEELIKPCTSFYETCKDGKIVVIGNSQVFV